MNWIHDNLPRRAAAPAGEGDSEGPSILWVGSLEGEAVARSDAWKESVMAGCWLLLDGEAEVELNPSPAGALVQGRLAISLLGGTSRLAECAACPNRTTPKLAGGAMDPAMRYAASQLSGLGRTSHSEKLFARGLLFQILSRVVAAEEARGPEGCPYSPEDICCVERAARHMEVRFAEGHSIRSIARAAGTNEFKLKRGFRRVYGTTVFGYLRGVRMQRARERFDGGERNVTCVAMDVGYSNPSHFARAFRGEFGVNPKAYLLGAER